MSATSAKIFAPAWMSPGAAAPDPDGGADTAANAQDRTPALAPAAALAPAQSSSRAADVEVDELDVAVVWSDWPAVLPLELWELLFRHLDSVDLVRFSELCRGAHELAHTLRTAKALMKPAVLACSTARCKHVIGSWVNLNSNFFLNYLNYWLWWLHFFLHWLRPW